jgi:hypothetical protein
MGKSQGEIGRLNQNFSKIFGQNGAVTGKAAKNRAPGIGSAVLVRFSLSFCALAAFMPSASWS